MLSHGVGNIEAVALYPPHSGAGRATLEVLSTTGAPMVVYVACGSVALALDVATLWDLGYELESPTERDLLPMTHHAEMVGTFRRG